MLISSVMLLEHKKYGLVHNVRRLFGLHANGEYVAVRAQALTDSPIIHVLTLKMGQPHAA